MSMRQCHIAIAVVATASVAQADTLYGPGIPHVNPLLGHWTLAKAQSNPTLASGGGCSPDLTFEPNDVKLTTNGQKVVTLVRFYNVGAKSVSVIGNTGGVSTYEFAGDGSIVMRTGLVNCTYRKS